MPYETRNFCYCSCLFARTRRPDTQCKATSDRAFPVAALRICLPVFRSISHDHLLRHFQSSAVALRHTSSNSVTRNYCCHAREVTLSFMDTLIIALSYLLTYLPEASTEPPVINRCVPLLPLPVISSCCQHDPYVLRMTRRPVLWVIRRQNHHKNTTSGSCTNRCT